MLASIVSGILVFGGIAWMFWDEWREHQESMTKNKASNTPTTDTRDDNKTIVTSENEE